MAGPVGGVEVNVSPGGFVGWEVGSDVGSDVGSLVGADVGPEVGPDVGTLVGPEAGVLGPRTGVVSRDEGAPPLRPGPSP